MSSLSPDVIWWLNFPRNILNLFYFSSEILSNISSFDVRASFGVDTVTAVYFITMETAEYQNILQLGDQPVFSVEECQCNANTTGNNYTGLNFAMFLSNFSLLYI